MVAKHLPLLPCLFLLVSAGACASTAEQSPPAPLAHPNAAPASPEFRRDPGAGRSLVIGGAGMLFLGEGQGGGFNAGAADSAGERVRRALRQADPLEDEFLARVARQLAMLPLAAPAAGWLSLAPAERLVGKMFLEAAARRCAYLAGVADHGDPWAKRWRDGPDHAAEWHWWAGTVSMLQGRLEEDGSVKAVPSAAGTSQGGQGRT